MDNHEVHSLFDDPSVQEAYDAWQQGQADHDAGIAARDEAMARAEGGADPLWLDEAMLAVKAVAYAQPELTSEDVADQLERTTREPRALGSVMRCAADQEWIVATGRFVPASHPSRHRAPIRVWASRIFVGGAAA